MSTARDTPAPELSVVVPAYNEEKLLGATLDAIRAGLTGAGFLPSEVELWVVDNDSTDRTAEIAVAAGGRVVHEPWRQIARARNAGAAGAGGRWLLFVDADTRPSSALLARARELMARGRCCGGGAVVSDADAGLRLRLAIGAWNTVSRLGRLACGAFLFCRADAFRELGGFNEELYAAEEVDLSWRLRDWGRQHRLEFRIIDGAPLDTSRRKLELYTPFELGCMALRGLMHPYQALRDRSFLDHWYDGRR